MFTRRREGEKSLGRRRCALRGFAASREKAIYRIEGALFQVERLDFDGRKAYVRRIDCDYYTDAITYTRVTVLDTFATDDGRQAQPTRRGRTIA